MPSRKLVSEARELVSGMERNDTGTRARARAITGWWLWTVWRGVDDAIGNTDDGTDSSSDEEQDPNDTSSAECMQSRGILRYSTLGPFHPAIGAQRGRFGRASAHVTVTINGIVACVCAHATDHILFTTLLQPQRPPLLA